MYILLRPLSPLSPSGKKSDLLEDFVSEVEDSDLAPIPFTLVAALDDSAPAEAGTVLAEDASLAALSEGCGIDVAVIVVRKSRAEAALWSVVASKTALSDMVAASPSPKKKHARTRGVNVFDLLGDQYKLTPAENPLVLGN
eukprot:GEMP01097227.1.p1 GENE.GEMP01097227.1~~GEMP01097227.1.p1  ORF type:complete len:141 (+),score=43.39 GEMP01097227.1:227-649(+)